MDKAVEAAARHFLAMHGLQPSKEQTAVVHALIEGRHATVNAVAGSGKTTTVVMLGAYLKHEGRRRRVLLLTYNRALKVETRARVKGLGLCDEIEAHSFHAAGVRYFSDSCRVDDGLNECVLELASAWRRQPRPWDFVVIDEAQDVDRLKFAFAARLVAKSLAVGGAEPPQWLVIGDARQSIYEYRGADGRFLRFADRGVWSAPDDARPWTQLKLSTSYRITPCMAAFVSEAMLASPGYIVSSRSPTVRAASVTRAGAAASPVRTAAAHAVAAGLVEYRVGSAFQNAERVGKEIIELMRGGTKPDDIFVLAGSVKQSQERTTPLQRINQLLAWADPAIPVYVPRTDDDDDDCGKEQLEGRVVFATFHAAKGRERPIVYVLGFEQSYFHYYARGHPETLCPNTLYVACTRAKQRLVLCAERFVGGHLPFLADRHSAPVWKHDVKVSGDFEYDLMKAEFVEKASDVPVADLLAHLPESVLSSALSHVVFRKTCNAALPSQAAVHDAAARTVTGTITMPDKVASKVIVGGNESVSDINGLALGPMLEVFVLKRSAPSLHKVVSDAIPGNKCAAVVRDFESIIEGMIWDADTTPVSAFLQLTAMYKVVAAAGTAGLDSLYTQLGSFNWLHCDAVKLALARLDQHIPNLQGANLEVGREAPMPGREKSLAIPGKERPLTLQGITDVETGGGADVYELKCTSGELSSSHKLQLVCYAYIAAANANARKAVTMTHRGAAGGGAAGGGAAAATQRLGGAASSSSSSISSSDVAIFQPTFHLLNVVSGERWVLETKELGPLREAVAVLAEGRYGDKTLVDDPVFLTQAAKLRAGAGLCHADFEFQASATAAAAKASSVGPGPGIKRARSVDEGGDGGSGTR